MVDHPQEDHTDLMAELREAASLHAVTAANSVLLNRAAEALSTQGRGEGEGRASDWVQCPICGEPDMQKTTDPEGMSLIACVNHGCASNGGDPNGWAASYHTINGHGVAYWAERAVAAEKALAVQPSPDREALAEAIELIRDATDRVHLVAARRLEIGPIATQAQTAGHALTRALTLLGQETGSARAGSVAHTVRPASLHSDGGEG